MNLKVPEFYLILEADYMKSYNYNKNREKAVALSGKTEAVPVLMYHWFYDLERGRKPNDQGGNWISAQVFDEQMKYLHDNNYYYASWDELREWIDNKIDLPRKTICLTDDDAYITFFTIAMPIFQKYEIPFTSFISTSVCDNKRDMLAFASDPFVTFESHSDRLHAHWDICYGKNVKELYEDIRKSVSYIGNHEVFAYPFGQYTEEYIEALKMNDFKLAFTTVNTKVKRGMNHYALPRVRISKDMSLDDYTKAIS